MRIGYWTFGFRPRIERSSRPAWVISFLMSCNLNKLVFFRKAIDIVVSVITSSLDTLRCQAIDIVGSVITSLIYLMLSGY